MAKNAIAGFLPDAAMTGALVSIAVAYGALVSMLDGRSPGLGHARCGVRLLQSPWTVSSRQAQRRHLCLRAVRVSNLACCYAEIASLRSQ
jgi:hypothetical protein